MQEKEIEFLQERYQESKAFEEQLGFISQQLEELGNFRLHLKDFDESKERKILASIGKGIYVESELKNKSLFVDVGANILVKKTSKETIEIIEQQIRRLGEFKIQLNERLETLAFEMQKSLSNLDETKSNEK